MNKKNDPLIAFSYADAQRLRETFFSPQKKRPLSKKKKEISRKIVISSLVVIAALVMASVVFFSLSYELLILPRHPLENKGLSLLSNTNSKIGFPGKDKRTVRIGNSSIHLISPPEAGTNVSFNLKKPINLSAGNLFLYLKKVHYPLKISVTARDTQFFSNSLHPLIIELNPTDGSSIGKVPIVFKNTNIQNANLAAINFINFQFYPCDKEKNIAEWSAEDKKWILIKDLVFVEGK